jgi:hypothetical protein
MKQDGLVYSFTSPKGSLVRTAFAVSGTAKTADKYKTAGAIRPEIRDALCSIVGHFDVPPRKGRGKGLNPRHAVAAELADQAAGLQHADGRQDAVDGHLAGHCPISVLGNCA